MWKAFIWEQVTGIEPALSAWEAEVLPLHHTCDVGLYYSASGAFRQAVWKIFCTAADTAAFQPPGPACHPGGQSALAGKIQPPNRRLPPLSGLAVKQLHRFEQDVHDQQELRKPHHFWKVTEQLLVRLVAKQHLPFLPAQEQIDHPNDKQDRPRHKQDEWNAAFLQKEVRQNHTDRKDRKKGC